PAGGGVMHAIRAISPRPPASHNLRARKAQKSWHRSEPCHDTPLASCRAACLLFSRRYRRGKNERAVGIDWHVIPPAIVGPKILPVLFAEQWVLAEKERLQGGSRNRPRHLCAATCESKECPSIPSSVFIVITRKSKVDLPPDRISESDIAGRVFCQTRISIEVMRTSAPVVAGAV